MAVVTGSLAFIVTGTRPPRYEASTTIQVGPAVEIANPDTGLMQVGQQLAQTYVNLVKTFPVLDATVKTLSLPFSASALDKMVTTRIVSGTALLVITVTYSDQVVVADIGNELARQLILNSPTSLSKDQLEQQKLLQSEIENAKAQLDKSRGDLAVVDKRLAGPLTDAETVEALTLRTKIVEEINSEQANLAQFTNTLAVLQRQNNANTMTVVESAQIPDSPVGMSPVSMTVLVALLGGLLTAGLALIVEYTSDSVRLPSEVSRCLGTTLLGTVPTFGRKWTFRDKLIAHRKPRSSVAEAYRALRVSLISAARRIAAQEGGRPQIFAITSPSPGEGKSVTAANLAVTFANTGLRVILIDADLRKPVQHLIFDVPNVVGLANLLTSSSLNFHQLGVFVAPEQLLKEFLTGPEGSHFDLKGDHGHNGSHKAISQAATETASDASSQVQERIIVQDIIQKTIIPGLDIIPAGQPPSNPSELLGTFQSQDLVRYLLDVDQYDVIILDTPPALTVSDSAVLATTIHANAVVVLQTGRTRRGAAIRTIQQMEELLVPVAGVILNRLNPKDADAGYDSYYSDSYNQERTKRHEGGTGLSEDGGRPLLSATRTGTTQPSSELSSTDDG